MVCSLLFISVAMFTCSADEGTDEGNDGSARVTLYNYTAEQPYDADCDVYIRVVANSATTEAYALAEKVSERKLILLRWVNLVMLTTL